MRSDTRNYYRERGSIPSSERILPPSLDLPLPASVDVERSILGSILLDNRAFSEAVEHLNSEDFSLDCHRKIWARMVALAESSCPIDTTTLVEALDRHGELHAIGDVAYVSSLLDGVPDRPSIRHYIDIVKDKALRRALIHAAETTIKCCYEGTQSGEELISASEAELSTLSERRSRSTGEGRITSWAQIPTLERLPAGSVNWIVEGIVPAGGVVLWAGESGSYKTWLSLWLAKMVQVGRDVLGRKTVQRPILYLDRENPLSLIQERCSLLEIHSSEDFRIWGGWQADPPPMIGDRRLLRIAQTMKPLIVFDSFIRFHGADENSATEMGRVMGDARALANAGASVILQHHKPKAEGTQYRGSSDIKAGVDLAFAVNYEKQQEIISVQCFKNRFGADLVIAIRPRLGKGASFELTREPTLQREYEEAGIVLGVIQEQPGISQSQILQLAGLPIHKTRSILKSGERKLWRTAVGPHGRLDYHPLAAESSFSPIQPIVAEKLKGPGAEPGRV